MIKIQHHWDYCNMCGPMVRCGKCGNNCCNGTYGKLKNGSECDACAEAYEIQTRDFQALIDWTKLHKQISLAIPTLDHYIPLIYSMGLSDKEDEISFFNDKAVAGSLTMTSVQFGA